MAPTIGATPPITNSPRQPAVGSAAIPAKPASVAPSGTQTMASVTANGRCRSGTYLASERRRVRHRSSQADTRNQPQNPERSDVVDHGHDDGGDAEHHHAPEERVASADPIAGIAGQRSTDHHAEIAERHDGAKRPASPTTRA